VLIRSPDLPLYIKSGGIYFLMADIYAKILINLWFLFYFILVIRPDSRAVLVKTRFKDRPYPIKNPFSLKLYIFSAVIRHFVITIASYKNRHTSVDARIVYT
jgi:hypothetical protein